MKTTCLINNYNYQDYVGDAIASALRQTVPFDEIIIVDDGSTDGSREIIKAKIEGSPNVTLVEKENGGQMSAFNKGYAASTGDIVFFLDSDDIYEESYLETALTFYHSHPECDFLYCGIQYFGASNQTELEFPKNKDLGYTVFRSYLVREWIGGPTSTLSARRSILDHILPYPNTEELRICADELVVYGASLVGARKFYLAQPLVRYRIHDRNGWHGKYDNDPKIKKSQKQRIVNLQRYLLTNNHISLDPQKMYPEFQARPRVDVLQRFSKYLFKSELSLLPKLRLFSKFLAYYIFFVKKP